MSTSTRSQAIDAVLAVAALHLAEQRKLDIDAPVEEYCPGFAALRLLERFEEGRPVLRAPSRKVTVKQLITHTSGLGYWFWNPDVLAWEQAVGAPKPMSGLRAVLDAPLVAEPGSRFEYSPATVQAMFSNQIGPLDFPAEIRSADPEAAFGLALGPGYKWGYGLLLNASEQPGRRRAWSGGWMGLFNTFFWVDPAAGVAGALYTQALPFLAPEALRLAEDFEAAVYASL